MSEDNLHEKPASHSLDSLLEDLRGAIQGGVADGNVVPARTPEPEAASAAPLSLEAIFGRTPDPAPPVEMSAPALAPEPPPVAEKKPAPFHVLNPDDPASVPPPIPSVIEATPDECALVERAADPALPPPPVSDAPPRVDWLKPDAGIANDLPVETEAVAPEPLAPAAPVEEESPLAALIPGSQETRPAPALDEEPSFELETEIRPEGLIQVACLFPEGDERKGQSFVNRLKESAQRMKKPITVQPVFLHTWSPASVDVSAWSTSAALSGADIVFVLAPRVSAPLFGKLAAEAAKAGTSGRMIPIELIQAPSLYADVLVDLSRKAHGPR